MEFRLEGAQHMLALSRRMKAAGNGELRRAMLKAMRDVVKPILTAQRREVRSLTGAPSQWRKDAARLTRAKVNTTARGAGITITVKGDGPARRYARYLNTGRWRHPLFGNKRLWYPQLVKAGWFDRPAREAASIVRRELEQTLDRFLRELEST